MRRHRLVSDQDHPIRVRCIPRKFRIWSILSGSALVQLSAFSVDPRGLPLTKSLRFHVNVGRRPQYTSRRENMVWLDRFRSPLGLLLALIKLATFRPLVHSLEFILPQSVDLIVRWIRMIEGEVTE